jgi:hypothetical protein
MPVWILNLIHRLRGPQTNSDLVLLESLLVAQELGWSSNTKNVSPTYSFVHRLTSA